MGIDDNIKNVKEGVAIVGDIIKAAGNNPNVIEAGSQLGKTALTITKTINNALLPLAAINFAFDKARVYFNEHFKNDIEEKTKCIPLENLVEPKASLAGPAIQGLAFSHEEKELKEMYLNLIASAMDSRIAGKAHPAFVEIIRQLNSEEARMIRNILVSDGHFEIVELRRINKKDQSYNIKYRHLMNVIKSESKEPTRNDNNPVMIDNWIRLGLVEVAYDKHSISENSYKWVDIRPEYIELKDIYNDETHNMAFEKGIIKRTSLGERFGEVVGMMDKQLSAIA